MCSCRGAGAFPLAPQAFFISKIKEATKHMSEPISDARLAANRENAQKSSGPRTPAGKAISSLNAVKCNLTGVHVVFATEEEAKPYLAHITSYQTLFDPVGPQESALVQSISDTWWRLSRIPALEQAIVTLASGELVEAQPGYAAVGGESILQVNARRQHEKELRNLHLQENRLTRRREREVAELERLQAARQAKEAEALAEAAKASLLAEHRHQPLTCTPGLGFVFSKDRFTSYMRRLTPAQKAKFLQDALAESPEQPQTQEAAA